MRSFIGEQTVVVGCILKRRRKCFPVQSSSKSMSQGYYDAASLNLPLKRFHIIFQREKGFNPTGTHKHTSVSAAYKSPERVRGVEVNNARILNCTSTGSRGEPSSLIPRQVQLNLRDNTTRITLCTI